MFVNLHSAILAHTFSPWKLQSQSGRCPSSSAQRALPRRCGEPKYSAEEGKSCDFLWNLLFSITFCICFGWLNPN